MPKYKVIIPDPFKKKLLKLSEVIVERLIQKVKSLEEEPYPIGSKKLKVIRMNIELE